MADLCTDREVDQNRDEQREQLPVAVFDKHDPENGKHLFARNGVSFRASPRAFSSFVTRAFNQSVSVGGPLVSCGMAFFSQRNKTFSTFSSL